MHFTSTTISRVKASTSLKFTGSGGGGLKVQMDGERARRPQICHLSTFKQTLSI